MAIPTKVPSLTLPPFWKLSRPSNFGYAWLFLAKHQQRNTSADERVNFAPETLVTEVLIAFLCWGGGGVPVPECAQYRQNNADRSTRRRPVSF